MKNKILKSIRLNIVITVLTAFLGFILNKVFAESLGKEALGLMNLFTQLIAYLSLAEMGLATASSYALYKPLAEKNNEKVSIIINTIDNFYKKVGISVLVIGFGLTFLIPSIIIENSFGKKLYIYWGMYVINTSLSYNFSKYPIILNANQEFEVSKKIQGLSKILFQIIQIFILIYFKSFFYFLFMKTLENIVSWRLLYQYFTKKYSFVYKTTKKDSSVMKNIKFLFLHQIGALIVFNTDYIVLSKFVSISIVATYSTYLMVYKAIMLLLGIVVQAINPFIGNFIALNSLNEVYNLWKKLEILFFYLGTIIIFVSVFMFTPFVKLWMGNEFLLPNKVLILILINLFINIIRLMIDSFKNTSGFFSDYYSPIIESIVNLSLSLYLVNKIGISGVIIGTIISNILVILILKPVMMYERCFAKKWYFYVKDMTSFILLMICSILASSYVLKLIDFHFVIMNWSNWVRTSVSLTILIGIISFLIFSLNKDFRDVIRLFYRKKNYVTDNIGKGV